MHYYMLIVCIRPYLIQTQASCLYFLRLFRMILTVGCVVHGYESYECFVGFSFERFLVTQLLYNTNSIPTGLLESIQCNTCFAHVRPCSIERARTRNSKFFLAIHFIYCVRRTYCYHVQYSTSYFVMTYVIFIWYCMAAYVPPLRAS